MPGNDGFDDYAASILNPHHAPKTAFGAWAQHTDAQIRRQQEDLRKSRENPVGGYYVPPRRGGLLAAIGGFIKFVIKAFLILILVGFAINAFRAADRRSGGELSKSFREPARGSEPTNSPPPAAASLTPAAPDTARAAEPPVTAPRNSETFSDQPSTHGNTEPASPAPPANASRKTVAPLEITPEVAESLRKAAAGTPMKIVLRDPGGPVLGPMSHVVLDVVVYRSDGSVIASRKKVEAQPKAFPPPLQRTLASLPMGSEFLLFLPGQGYEDEALRQARLEVGEPIALRVKMLAGAL